MQRRRLLRKDKTTLVLYYDGLCEPRNPGGVSAGGWIIQDPDGVVLHSDHRCFREGRGSTNNWAEYCAAGFGLRWLVDNLDLIRQRQIKSIVIRGDSMLSICQLTGEWRCLADNMLRLRGRCWELIAKLQAAGIRIGTQWIPREQNSAADRLSQLAYEERTGQKVRPRVKEPSYSIPRFGKFRWIPDQTKPLLVR